MFIDSRGAPAPVKPPILRRGSSFSAASSRSSFSRRVSFVDAEASEPGGAAPSEEANNARIMMEHTKLAMEHMKLAMASDESATGEPGDAAPSEEANNARIMMEHTKLAMEHTKLAKESDENPAVQPGGAAPLEGTINLDDDAIDL